jgi:hypothetical protein
MRISEIIIDPNKKLLDQLRTSDIDMFYKVYETYQRETNNFTISADDLYDKNIIYSIIYYIIHNIEILTDRKFPNNSQIIIAFNELLEYFNKKK